MKNVISLAAVFVASNVAFGTPIFTSEVEITGWTGVTHHDWWTQGNAHGIVNVRNSLAETDAGFFGLPTPPHNESGALSSSVTWADAEASSYRGTYADPGTSAPYYYGGNAKASLDLNMTGAPNGSRAEGYASAGFGGYTFDGSDGTGDGQIKFDVGFEMNATVQTEQGQSVDGLFGIRVDAYSTDWTTYTDLNTWLKPTVYSSYFDTTFEMTYTEVDGDFSWYYAYSDEDVALVGGTISDTLVASFSFVPTTNYSTIFDYVEIAAFSTAKASVPDSGSTLALFGIGFLGLVGMRRRFAK